MTMNEKWNRLSGAPIENIKETISQDIQKYIEDYELQFIVGCDSQVRKTRRKGLLITYVTVIVMRRVGKGGIAYYTKSVEPLNFLQPKKRLWNETYKCSNVVMWLDELLLDYCLEVEDVHLDLNQNKKFLSNAVVKECVGFITGFGKNCQLKPNAWASSCVADRKTI